ncbi:hypothetical protein L211DRAFT_638788 [Terfezia boudieri ATCC MYA-4762]|uniref:Uncharacterized protein n=1 Tax=Terfezia boudieri ATCC MYA-4762 TaxID=1051890 RepID=A0A3N4LF57_9PEZI|nr:hypothetical protein L211DRAFT_638788 [Terfezia boudieri ATCC MYA-4762]
MSQIRHDMKQKGFFELPSSIICINGIFLTFSICFALAYHWSLCAATLKSGSCHVEKVVHSPVLILCYSVPKHYAYLYMSTLAIPDLAKADPLLYRTN